MSSTDEAQPLSLGGGPVIVSMSGCEPASTCLVAPVVIATLAHWTSTGLRPLNRRSGAADDEWSNVYRRD
jgi:hypothetical protein